MVLHFNSKFKDVVEAKRIALTTLDLLVQLTDILIIEIDMQTFSGETSFLQIYTKYVMDISAATNTHVHFCVFIEN